MVALRFKKDAAPLMVARSYIFHEVGRPLGNVGLRDPTTGAGKNVAAAVPSLTRGRRDRAKHSKTLALRLV